MNIEEFRQQNPQQIKSYPLALQALWYEYQNDWHKSHKLIDTEPRSRSASLRLIATVLGFMHIYIVRREI